MDEFERCLADAPPAIAVEPLRDRWAALRPHYDVDNWQLPLPPWAMRRYDDPGPRAWQTLGDDLARAPGERPFCLYIHVPFCTSKCHFCDCYSFMLAGHARRHVDGYIDRLIDELRQWATLGTLSQRPVSTVHLGGGTPTFLDEGDFRRLCVAIGAHFRVGPRTEWALESTVAGMTPNTFAALHELGFRRLHVGAQSVEDDVRRAIGRRSTAAELFGCLQRGRELGWVVSVDLICGLPGQTAGRFVAGIETLAGHGVNGFSLYELLIYPQNQRWATAAGLYPRRHGANFALFLMGAQRLEGLGYRRNLFNHWADAADDNRYFTFPMRDEDCLAVGAIADGLFGDYHFRHPRYAAYLRGGDGQPALEGGLRRTARESALRPLAATLLAGHVAAGPWANHHLSDGHLARLFDRWQAAGLIERQDADGWNLTGSGSWFVGNMIRELSDAG